MNLDSPDNHGWDDIENVIWSDIIPDLSELLVDIEDIDVAETNNENELPEDDSEGL